MPAKYCIVYMTASGVEEAQEIASELIRERLAACVNLINDMHSIYRWKGKIHKEREVVLIAKTRVARVPRLIRKVKAMLRSECPCIVSLPIAQGYAPFLKWIDAETNPRTKD